MAKAKKKSEIVAEEVAELEVTEAVTEADAAEDVDAEEISAPEMTQEDIRLVEAILFASANAIDVRTIAERFPEERAELIPDILEHLRVQYEARGVNLVQRDKRWAFRTAPDLGEQMKLEKEQPRKFTRSAMETMAVIAYHQPVTRAEIENIRGVATSPGALDTLMEAGWIKPGKRREVPGRPVTWLSTQGFLDHFGLERLADLPGMDELKAAGLLDKRPAIEAMPNTGDLFDGAEHGDDDPQDVTDEDLLGGGEDDTIMESNEEDYEDDADDDFDDEEEDNEDSH